MMLLTFLSSGQRWVLPQCIQLIGHETDCYKMRGRVVEIRVDFPDSQGGKGACDRKAATIKNKIKVYLNSENDVETAKQMKIAIESRSGIQGVRVMLCDTPPVPKLEPLKWEGVSFVNNIPYCEKGMKVWREYNIGQGKFIEWREFNLPETIEIPHITAKLREAFLFEVLNSFGIFLITFAILKNPFANPLKKVANLLMEFAMFLS